MSEQDQNEEIARLFEERRSLKKAMPLLKEKIFRIGTNLYLLGAAMRADDLSIGAGDSKFVDADVDLAQALIEEYQAKRTRLREIGKVLEINDD